ncbi:uncharacterized protein [Arachis hypogaea]|uniref:uncharacterized protein n=1 Tax=Arachis hypogaea TaxID=3818 RepID=UPI000DEC24C0|nr:uncharacterized protein LOC112722910 [Arachis hypogaea]
MDNFNPMLRFLDILLSQTRLLIREAYQRFKAEDSRRHCQSLIQEVLCLTVLMITSTELQWRQESEQELALRKSKQRIHILKSYLDELNNESYLSGEEEEESSYEFTSDTKKYLYATAVEVLISGNHDQGQNNKHTIFHNISSTKKKRCCTYCEVK